VLTFVVMPCLDEAELVAGTAASLGFTGATDLAPGTHLIAVDNGSTDDTLRVLDRVRQQSRAPVHVVSEPTRGYVPPRRRGVVEAQALARAMGVGEEDVLILQADADTTYREGYVATMRSAAASTAGVMLEGSTKAPPDFAAAHPAYWEAQRVVDDGTDPLDAEDEDEVVLDDKVCGYRLSDYLRWGGLFEERTNAGDSIHAETARLFIRARLLHGARKIRVNPAGAASSRRKLIENPWLQYATVGFPREASWVRAQPNAARAIDIDQFSKSVLQGGELEAVRLRRAHQLALFRYLPALVAESAGTTQRSEQPKDVNHVLNALPSLSATDMAAAPGRAMTEVLGLIDRRPDLFDWR